MTVSRKSLLVIGAVLSFAAVALALVSQHRFDMQPCPWCVLQRLIFTVIGVVCLVGLAAPRAGGVVALLLALSGVAAALWQHFVAASSDSCNLTLADRIISGLSLDSLLPEIYQARASCADAAVSMLGVPYEFYSLVLFVVLAGIGWRAAAGTRPAGR
jgi:disulfide bond formation protein DsbB